MAGVLTQSNIFQLTGESAAVRLTLNFTSPISSASTAPPRLINSTSDNPQAEATTMFPRAAAANRSIFYDAGERAQRSQVYAELNARYASAAGSSATQKALAMYGGSSANVSGGERGASRPLHAGDACARQRELPLANSRCPQRHAGRGFLGREQPFAV